MCDVVVNCEVKKMTEKTNILNGRKPDEEFVEKMMVELESPQP